MTVVRVSGDNASPIRLRLAQSPAAMRMRLGGVEAARLKFQSGLPGVTGPTGATGPTGPAGADAPDYATRTIAAAATIDGSITYLRTAGYATAGDGGGALYRKVGGQPTHSGWFQSVDGAYWSLDSSSWANADRVVDIRQFGAIGNASSNPLSTRFATLAAAQVLYPHATSLTNEIDWAAFQAAINYCNLQYGAEVYVPTGRYWTNVRLTLRRFVNIRMSPDAIITATAVMDAMLASFFDADPVNDVNGCYLNGGQWDCAFLAEKGFWLESTTDIYCADVRLNRCDGIYIHIVDRGGFIGDSIWINRNASTVPPNESIGIQCDASDCHFHDCQIIGVHIGLGGTCYNSKIYACHVWNDDVQGRLENGYRIEGNDAILVGCQVDGPFSAAFGIFNHRVSLIGCAINYPEDFSTGDNVDDCVYIDGDYKTTVIGCQWFAASASYRLRYEFSGTTTSLHAFGNRAINLVSPFSQVYLRESSAAVSQAMISGTQVASISNYGTASSFAISTNELVTIQTGSSYLDTILAYQDGAVEFPRVGTTASATNARLDGAGQRLLKVTSSVHYKRDIEPLEDKRADAVLGLEPVWYRSKAEADDPAHSWYGLIAEDVAAVDPRLVSWEGDTPDGVSYDRLAVMLLSIVKRQQKQLEDLQRKVGSQGHEPLGHHQ